MLKAPRDVTSSLSSISSPTDLASQLTRRHNLDRMPPYSGGTLQALGKDIVLVTGNRDLAFLDRCVWHVATTLLGLVDDLASVVHLEVFFLHLLRLDRS